ncbi:hypothetical protein FB567DRAFT_634945 [Paraphoma chrysanthemicola]|uniref:Rhodopsin domain-containing protein n=1 Tax=Paraphoma chrysanthemicola TaxID=798071 RepID=A0A8K0VR53_9PLEO|nr:hypothetical protein FB567DRAFT_634945 [Paraphoma chrysanthemicola]
MTVLSSANVHNLTEAYRNRSIIAASVCYPLAILAVILRFTARKISGAGLWYDDCFALVGLAAVGVFMCLMLVDLPDDSTLAGNPIPEATLMANAKTVYVAELFYYVIQVSLKFSILAFYWRIFSVAMRLPIYFVCGFITMWFIASILVAAFQCVPVASLWEPSLRASAKCVELAPFFFGTSIPNILADVFLLVLPMPYVWRLKITLAQKFVVLGFFLLGGFVLIASIIRLRLLLLLDIQGFYANWAVENAVFWSLVENCMGVICVCLPSLRPVIKLIPWISKVGISLGSGRPSGFRTSVSGLEQGTNKTKQPQVDEFELLESGNASHRWVEIEQANEEHSIKTLEGECTSVRTRVQVSSSDIEQPAETV